MTSSYDFFNRIRADLKNLKKTTIIVGVQEEPGKNTWGDEVSSDEEMMKISYVHEFGYDIKVTNKMRAWLHYNGIHLKKETKLIHIPERSYIRRGFKEATPMAQNQIHSFCREFLEGNLTIDELRSRVGEIFINTITANMGIGGKPITVYTYKQRKSAKTARSLIDSGDLRNHVTYRVEEK